MEALYSSETSVEFQGTTVRYIPEDSKMCGAILVTGPGGP
jgi:hypothetical protein